MCPQYADRKHRRSNTVASCVASPVDAVGSHRTPSDVAHFEHAQNKRCRPLVGESGFRLYDGPDLKLFILVRWDRSSFVCCWSTEAQLMIFFCFRFPAILFGRPGHNTLYLRSSVESSSVLLHSIKRSPW